MLSHSLIPSPGPRRVRPPRRVLLQHCEQLQRRLLGLVVHVEGERVLVRSQPRVPVRESPRDERVAAGPLARLAGLGRQARRESVPVYLGLLLPLFLVLGPGPALGAAHVHLCDL